MNNGAKNIVTRVIDLVMKCLLVVIMVFPFYWMVITAFKTQKESMIFPPTLIPSQITFESFSTVMEKIPFGLFFKNSLIIALSVVLLQFIVVVPAAYGFAKYNFRCKNLFFAFVLLGFMLPQQITFAPSYLMFNKVGLLNSYAPMIIPFIGNAFGIFLLRQYFLQIPQEIIEAARLDDDSEGPHGHLLPRPSEFHLFLELLLLAVGYDQQQYLPYASHRSHASDRFRGSQPVAHRDGGQPDDGASDSGGLRLCQRQDPQGVCLLGN